MFLLILLVGTTLVAFATHNIQSSHITPLGASTHRSSFGSTGMGSTGWLIPANAMMATSHTANKSLSGFIEATLNVFPYQIQAGTTLYLSLYVNDQLASSQKYDLTASYSTPAVVTRTMGNGVADFSNSMLGFMVTEFPMNNAFPAGTKVTVLAWVSNPIWVQVDNTPLSHSVETLGVASYSPPSRIVPETGTIAPYTLSVGMESSAE